MNKRCAEKVVNWLVYEASIFPNLDGVAVGLLESALTLNALLSPNVVLVLKTTPRGLVTLKKLKGRKFGAENHRERRPS
jgi:hypothetical protein